MFKKGQKDGGLNNAWTILPMIVTSVRILGVTIGSLGTNCQLSGRPIDIAQVSRGAAVSARFAASAAATASTINAFVLRTRKWATKKMVDLTTTPRKKRKPSLCALRSQSANPHT
jgi:hypothetical protein